MLAVVFSKHKRGTVVNVQPPQILYILRKPQFFARSLSQTLSQQFKINTALFKIVLAKEKPLFLRPLREIRP